MFKLEVRSPHSKQFHGDKFAEVARIDYENNELAFIAVFNTCCFSMLLFLVSVSVCCFLALFNPLYSPAPFRSSVGLFDSLVIFLSF